MRWFGKNWGAPVCRDMEHAEMPTSKCAGCELPFDEEDRGVLLPFAGGPEDPPELAYHHGCLLWSVGVSNIHILKHGLPLCAFQPGPPVHWPDGHQWVREHEWPKATCPGCRKVNAVDREKSRA